MTKKDQGNQRRNLRRALAEIVPSTLAMLGVVSASLTALTDLTADRSESALVWVVGVSGGVMVTTTLVQWYRNRSPSAHALVRDRIRKAFDDCLVESFEGSMSGGDQ